MPRSTSTSTTKKRPMKFGKPGKWYLQHTYQERDVDQIPLTATTEAEAFAQGREILKKYPRLDEACIVFISADHSLKYVSPQRL